MLNKRNNTAIIQQLEIWLTLVHFQVRFKRMSTLPPKTLIALRAVTWDSVVKQCSIALGKGDGELLEEVAYGGRVLLPCAFQLLEYHILGEEGG